MLLGVELEEKTMSVVYKYMLQPQENNRDCVSMPADAKVLHAGAVGSELYIWALLPDKKAEPVKRSFTIVGTGWEFDAHADDRHIGTALMHNGELVFHVFETAS
jgi:hypothetical protein